MSFIEALIEPNSSLSGHALVKKFQYDSSNNLIYIGASWKRDMADSEEAWTITKLTYDGLNVSVMEVHQNVAWSNRASLDWS